MPEMVVIVRTASSADKLPPAVKAISESLDPKLFPEIRQMKLLYHDHVLQVAIVVSLIGMVAVLLAGIGISPFPSFAISELCVRLYGVSFVFKGRCRRNLSGFPGSTFRRVRIR
jgi:hypothetical protein